MKKVLLGSTALVLSAGFAWAEVEVSGDGRMGIIGGGTDDIATVDVDETDPTFTSRIRISFAASGETDGGLTFGGSIRADNAGGGAAGTAGSVYAEGAFGKISMGDVDGAAKAAVGHVSGVGLTGLGDRNEMTYIANVGPDLPGVLYEYSAGDLTFYASADRPNVSDEEAYAVGASYGFGAYTVALGYENVDNGSALGDNADHIVAGVSAGFGDATVKATYGNGEGDAADIEQWAVSVDYVFGATTATAFYKTAEVGGVDADAYGIGASYDLGGGASLVGGVVDADDIDDPVYDFGLKMSF